MLDVLEKDFTDGRKITPLIVKQENKTGIGFKNIIQKEGELQEGVIFYIPTETLLELKDLLNKNV